MYLHIGSDVVVREKEVIAIIGRRGDADKSKINRNFLEKKKTGRYDNKYCI